MSETLQVLVANPAGNKTILVMDQVSQERYTEIAEKLLAKEELFAEQVGFIVSPKNGSQGRMEMCGQEFCGNASRSFGLYLAQILGIEGPGSVTIEVSGAENPLQVEIDTLKNHTKISMPLPTETLDLKLEDYGDLHMVIFDGIIHVVVFNLEPSLEIFNRIKSLVLQKYRVPAVGVMFCRTDNSLMTPVVWVKDIDFTYFEGSCGSGSVAAATVLAKELKDGSHSFILQQPKGSLEIIIIKEKGLIKNAFLQGQVELHYPLEVTI